jgi:hypothetical protein
MAARQEAGSRSLKNSVVSRQLNENEATNRGAAAAIGPNVARFLVNKDALSTGKCYKPAEKAAERVSTRSE